MADLVTESYVWSPDPHVSADSKQTYTNTTSTATVNVAAVTHPSDSTIDYTATVLARSAVGEVFRVDLRCLVSSIGSTAAMFENEPSANPYSYGGMTAYFELVGSTLYVRFVGPSGANATASCVLNKQVISTTATAPQLSQLPLTLWAEASYSGAPWNGTASTDVSGSTQLTAGSAPTVGTAVNGLTPADFNGSSHYLVSSLTLDNLLDATGTGSFWIAFLFKADTAAADPGDGLRYSGTCLLGAGGGVFAVWYNASGFGAERSNGSSNIADWQACSTGNWHLGQVKYDAGASTLYTRIDSLDWSAGTVCAGNMSPSARAVSIGRNQGGSGYFDGKILRIIAARRLPTTAESAALITSCNYTFGLAL